MICVGCVTVRALQHKSASMEGCMCFVVLSFAHGWDPCGLSLPRFKPWA